MALPSFPLFPTDKNIALSVSICGESDGYVFPSWSADGIAAPNQQCHRISGLDPPVGSHGIEVVGLKGGAVVDGTAAGNIHQSRVLLPADTQVAEPPRSITSQPAEP